jgi:hypothetical protein
LQRRCASLPRCVVPAAQTCLCWHADLVCAFCWVLDTTVFMGFARVDFVAYFQAEIHETIPLLRCLCTWGAAVDTDTGCSDLTVNSVCLQKRQAFFTKWAATLMSCSILWHTSNSFFGMLFVSIPWWWCKPTPVHLLPRLHRFGGTRGFSHLRCVMIRFFKSLHPFVRDE